MKNLLFFLLLGLSFATVAQSPAVFHGIVRDSLTQEPCAYVRIYNASLRQGVLAEFTGRFEIAARPGDTLVFLSPGYRKRLLIAATLPEDSIVVLQPEGSVLDEQIVLADDAPLYRWMDVVFSEKMADRTAKTYLEVETFLEKNQVELVEAYYNGRIRGGDIRSLEFKNGRMALKRAENTSFMSTETSKAILQLRLNEGSDHLPDTPFEYPLKKMRKLFRLELNKTYTSQKGHAVYIISFAPRDPGENAFSGTIWLDTVTKKALKLSLSSVHARVHPFVPLFETDTIVSVDMGIHYVFIENSAVQLLDFIYFDYSLDYQNRDRTHYAVETNVIVHPYDYGSSFIPPYFKGHETRHSDYRKIQAFPYNEEFWTNEEHPVSQETRENNDVFFRNREVVFSSDTSQVIDLNGSRYANFESPYRFWSMQRIGITNTLQEQAPQPLKTQPRYAVPAQELYELSAQIYMDVNVYNAKTYIRTATIFDPYATFYKLPVDTTTDCFLNLYMDVVEIQRRKFEQQITGKNLSQAGLDAAYSYMQAELEKTTERFFREVEHGSNRRGMEKWNAYVIQELGIDNFRYFGLYPPESEKP